MFALLLNRRVQFQFVFQSEGTAEEQKRQADNFMYSVGYVANDSYFICNSKVENVQVIIVNVIQNVPQGTQYTISI